MNPQVAAHGRSHKGAFMYYMHDKNSNTRERIAWAETYNTITNDVDKAWKVMAYTAMNQDRLKESAGRSMAGRKDSKPVMAYSLSWHPNHDPDRDHMRETAIESLKVLGLEEHEAYIVAHRDTPHRHVHVIVNRIHPTTGLIAGDSYTWERLSDFARIYCKEHNMEYAPKREENYQKRQEGKQTKYRDTKIQEAWDLSDSGWGFLTALEDSGYLLAQGRKRLVVIDPYGKVHNPVHHIEGIKSKEFNARMADVDKSALRDADEMAKIVQARHEKKKLEYAEEKTEKLAQGSEILNDKHHSPPQEISYEKDACKDEQPKNAVDAESDKRAEEKTRALNGLQDRHIEQQANLSNYHNRRIRHEEAKLDIFYDFEEQKNQIKTLQEKIDNAPWWHSLFGLTRRDRNALATLNENIADGRKRYEERIDTLHSKFAYEREKLRETYERRSVHLTNSISVMQWQREEFGKNAKRQKKYNPDLKYRRGRRSGPSYGS